MGRSQGPREALLRRGAAVWSPWRGGGRGPFASFSVSASRSVFREGPGGHCVCPHWPELWCWLARLGSLSLPGCRSRLCPGVTDQAVPVLVAVTFRPPPVRDLARLLT